MTDTQTDDQTHKAKEGTADPTAAERLITIRRMQSVIDADANVVADKKEELHDAKETWNVHVMELGDFIRDGSLPLFEAKSEQPEKPNEAPGTAGDSQPDGWRTIHLSELTDPAITPATLAKLANAGIETIGEMADLSRASRSSDKTASDKFDLTHIPGIGAKAAGDIEDAMAAFWARRKDQQAIEAYRANIREIPTSAIRLPKDKSLMDYYCAPELADATDDKPAEVRAFEHNKALYTITASDGTEDGVKTAEAWRLVIPGTHYAALIRNRGPHPTDLWRGYEGQVVVVNGKERIMTEQVRIVMDEKG